MATENPQSIFIDCDPGWDDAAAICLAYLLRDEIHVLGLSAVFGNGTVEEASKNIFAILSTLEVSMPPVFLGASCALAGRPKIHAGYANKVLNRVDLDKSSLASYLQHIHSLSDAPLVFDQAKSPKLLLCMGPLTNAWELLSSFPKKIDRLYVLGGSISGGNHTANAEFNFSMDSLAARNVLASSNEIYLVPLDVCKMVPAYGFLVTRPTENRCINTWNKIIREYLNENPSNVAPIFDPLLVLMVLFPRNFLTKQVNLTVCVSEDDHDGEVREQISSGGFVNIAYNVNLEGLLQDFHNAIDKYV